MKKTQNTTSTGWTQAVVLCESYRVRSDKADTLLSRYCKGISSEERRRCQFLFFGAIRHRRLIETVLAPLMKRAPRKRVGAILEIALAEMLGAPRDDWPKVVDFAVGRVKHEFSKQDAGFVNAVLRRAIERLAELLATSETEEVGAAAVVHSHPDWLAKRWEQAHGAASTLSLMRWNQEPAQVTVRWRGKEGVPLPDFLKETQWESFYTVEGAPWSAVEPLLSSGHIFAQDPATRIPVMLLQVEPGEQVLDLCAAPGGKSLMMADMLGDDPKGRLVAVEKPGNRVAQLDENLAKLDNGEGCTVELVEADLFNVPVEPVFQAVLLDAPCSNTGVLRRRPDAKWRLQEEDIEKSAALQLRMLQHASGFVAKGGRIVYSTCSIEADENQQVVERFLSDNEGFKLELKKLSFPWEHGHDGGGAFLLRRID